MMERWETALEELGLRPVWESWHGHYALTSNNDVVFLLDSPFLLHDPQASPEPVENPHTRRVTYAWAAMKCPDLAHLMPQQGADDPTCSYCDGSGLLRLPKGEPVPDGYPCWCAGLGWLPDGDYLLGFN